MNAVQIRAKLLEHVDTEIAVLSTCNNETYKGTLKQHCGSWQLEVEHAGMHKPQVIYFPTCIVEIVPCNPFVTGQVEPLVIRLKNRIRKEFF